MSGFPYSDNMYSGLDDSDNENDLYAAHAGLGLGDSSYVPGAMRREHVDNRHDHQPNEEEVLSPSDGYFGQSSTTDAHGSNDDPSHPSYAQEPQQAFATHNVPPSTSSPAAVPASSQVPHVPNIWVSDPSLAQGSTAESKAREAQQERDQNRRLFASDADRLNQYDSSSQNLGDPQPHSSTTQPPSTHNSRPPPPHSRDGTSSAFSLLNPPHLHTNNLRGPSGSASGSSSTPPHRAGHRYTPSSSSYAAGAPSASSSSGGPSSRPRRSATSYSERSSLFSEAPPAYTPSPTSPISSGSPYTNNSYQTFSPSTQHNNMGRPSESESHGLLAGQTYQSIPESMGGQPDDNGHYTYPEPAGWRDRIRQFDWRKHWKLIVLGVVLALITIGFLVSSVFGVKNSKIITFPGGDADKSPIERPDVPVVGDDGTKLAYPPYDRDMELPEILCGKDNIKFKQMTISLEMGPAHNLSIIQDISDQPSNGKDVHVTGDVVFRRSGAGTPGPSISIETTTNDDRIELELHWDGQGQQLRILTPRTLPWDSGLTSPCITARVTVWTPPGSVLDRLNIQGVHLGVKLLDNLSLQLTSFARFASTVGSVVAATDGEKDSARLMREPAPGSFNLDTRFVEVKTLSSSIEGAWPLYDYLGLETISGTIRAGVNPKPALKEKPLPAILYGKSISGHLEIYEPVTEAAATFALQQQLAGGVLPAGLAPAEDLVPPRTYGVDIHSMSGSVKATVAFTHSCKVHTTSGRVDLTLLPVLDQTEAGQSFLETGTTSGTTVVGVLDAMWTDIEAGKFVVAPLVPDVPPVPAPPALPVRDNDPYDVLRSRAPAQPDQPNTAAAPVQPAPVVNSAPALRGFSGRHTATSAAIHVTYPPTWEGYIDTDSLSGKIDVGGEGVEIIKREDEYPGIKKHVYAKKGPSGKGGVVKVHTTSGRIGVLVGR